MASLGLGTASCPGVGEEHPRMTPVACDREEGHPHMVPVACDREEEHPHMAPVVCDWEEEHPHMAPVDCDREEEHLCTALIVAGIPVDFYKSRKEVSRTAFGESTQRIGFYKGQRWGYWGSRVSGTDSGALVVEPV